MPPKDLNPLDVLKDLKDKGYDVQYMDTDKARLAEARQIVGFASVWDGSVVSGRSSHHPDVLIRVERDTFHEVNQKESGAMGYTTLDLYLSYPWGEL